MRDIGIRYPVTLHRQRVRGTQKMLMFGKIPQKLLKVRSFFAYLGCSKKVFVPYVLCAYVLCAVFFPLAARQAIPPSVHRIAEEAFAQKSYAATVTFFEKASEKAVSADDRCTLSQLLAGYEERHGNYTTAAVRYRNAATRAAASDTTQEHVLLLAAARAFLAGGNAPDARAVLEKLDSYQRSSGILSDHAAAASVYRLWLRIAEGELESALQRAKNYSTDAQFRTYHPALLFTLWWIDNDAAAGRRLRREFPETPEAKAVGGELLIQPSTFWYLMPRSNNAATAAISAFGVLPHTAAQSAEDSENRIGQSGILGLERQESTTRPAALQVNTGRQKTDTEPSDQSRIRNSSKKIRSYQIGFYKTRSYATGLVEKLRQAGFEAYIREEPRPSGTVYFAVLVDETPDSRAGTIGEKLKDAGYQPFLLPS